MAMTSLQVQEKDGVTAVSFGDVRLVDEASVQQVEKDFQEPTLQTAMKGKLLLDFARVEAISSQMIGLIVRLHNQCKREGGRLKLCSLSPSILEAFRITGLRKMLDIYPDEARALESYRSVGADPIA